jgi:hypothetical protein
MEALAYIPPPLVNAVRYYSRTSPTAVWHKFDFDAGRYSFCAIDISDHLDVNRLFADAPRFSAPHLRHSLSYLFEKGGSRYGEDDHKEVGENQPKWDTFMEKFRTVDEDTYAIDFKEKMPLISMADLNLALGGASELEPMKPVFYNYVTKDDDTVFDSMTLKRMPFATEGLFPKYTTVPGHPDIKAFDLNESENQPFPSDKLSAKGGGVLSDALLGNGANPKFKNKDSGANGYELLSGFGFCALKDYLDEDRKPISLALPTMERTPMICGIQPTVDGAFTVDIDPSPENTADENIVQQVTPDERIVELDVKFTIGKQWAANLQKGHLSALVAYPFAHEDSKEVPSYKLDGRLSFFLASGDVTLRASSGNENVPHLESREIAQSSVEPEKGLINIKIESQDTLPVKDIKYPVANEEDVLFKAECPFAANANLVGALSQKGILLEVTLRWTQQKNQQSGAWEPSYKQILENFQPSYIHKVKSGFKPYKWSSQSENYCQGIDEDFKSNTSFEEFLKGGGSKRVSLNAAVWLRIKDEKEGTIVDMVPACVDDDGIHLGATDKDPGIKVIANQYAGKSYPLIPLKSSVSFDYSVQGLYAFYKQNAASGESLMSPQTMYVADPRFNHAPEHWFTGGKEDLKQGWLAAAKACMASDANKEKDIFMATSDAGYMQSKYELAHLPNFTGLEVSDSTIAGTYESPETKSALTTIPSSYEATLNKHLMWRNSNPYSSEYEAFERLPWTNDGSNFKMTPYSDNINALMSVFANTPLDWKRSSTNEVEEATDYLSLTAKEFNKKYAYNEYTEENKITWLDLKQIAQKFMSAVRTGENKGDWSKAWRDLGWSSDDKTLCGIELEEDGRFWTSDRKFLYGFWRDSMAPKQQLYLIFVRAEPMMIGVGDLKMMPPQQGARAVAVVWRDPASTKKSGESTFVPHKTRVLFYRQFE